MLVISVRIQLELKKIIRRKILLMPTRMRNMLPALVFQYAPLI
jgi:hypothetical protein